MKIITEDRLLQIWGYEHATNSYPDVNRDILQECSGVKTLTMVHRNKTFIGEDAAGLPQFGELLTWLFKGHNGERAVLQAYCQWHSDRTVC